MKLGYIRSSTLEGCLDSQRNALSEYGVDKVYEERKSGTKWSNRHQLLQLLDSLREDDMFICTRIDRISRNLFQLHQIAQEIERKGAHLVVLEQSIDTSTPTGRLLFQILGSISEMEAELIKSRLAAGKKASGNYGGRKPKLDQKQIKLLNQCLIKELV